MYCGRCGTPSHGDDLFCPGCGTPLPQESGADADVHPTTVAAAGRPRPDHTIGPILIAAAVLVLIGATIVGVLTLRAASTTNGQGAVAAPTIKPTPTHSPLSASASPSAPRSTAPTTAPTVTVADIYRREQSGVVRIETLSCDHSGIATGFLLTPTLVATVDHVIDQAAVVSLIAGA